MSYYLQKIMEQKKFQDQKSKPHFFKEQQKQQKKTFEQCKQNRNQQKLSYSEIHVNQPYKAPAFHNKIQHNPPQLYYYKLKQQQQQQQNSANESFSSNNLSQQRKNYEIKQNCTSQTYNQNFTSKSSNKFYQRNKPNLQQRNKHYISKSQYPTKKINNRQKISSQFNYSNQDYVRFMSFYNQMMQMNQGCHPASPYVGMYNPLNMQQMNYNPNWYYQYMHFQQMMNNQMNNQMFSRMISDFSKLASNFQMNVDNQKLRKSSMDSNNQMKNYQQKRNFDYNRCPIIINNNIIKPQQTFKQQQFYNNNKDKFFKNQSTKSYHFNNKNHQNRIYQQPKSDIDYQIEMQEQSIQKLKNQRQQFRKKMREQKLKQFKTYTPAPQKLFKFDQILQENQNKVLNVKVNKYPEKIKNEQTRAIKKKGNKDQLMVLELNEQPRREFRSQYNQEYIRSVKAFQYSKNKQFFKSSQQNQQNNQITNFIQKEIKLTTQKSKDVRRRQFQPVQLNQFQDSSIHMIRPTTLNIQKIIQIHQPIKDKQVKANDIKKSFESQNKEININQNQFMPKNQHKAPVKIEFPNQSLLFQQDSNISLAQAFLKRKTNLEKNICKEKSQKKQKSKQQLFEIRKQMMKKKDRCKTPQKKFVSQQIQDGWQQNKNLEKKSQIVFQKSKHKDKLKEKSKSREPPPELLNRLIKGIKVKLQPKEMHNLTLKNFQQLPEIKKRKQQQKKKEEFKKRMQTKKEYQKKLKNRIKKNPSKQMF